MVLNLLPLHTLASGLRWRRGCLSSDATVNSDEKPVHHTFIHYDVVEADDQPDIKKCVSNILDGVPRTWGDDAAVETHIHDIVAGYQLSTSNSRTTAAVETVQVRASSLESVCTSSTTASEEEKDHVKEDESLGSVKHAQGRCKPCAWHRKPSGCSKGDACTFCHTCDADALRKKKKERLERVKEHRRAVRERSNAAMAAVAELHTDDDDF